MKLKEKLDSARKELLDMSLRNPLLNYRHPKSKGIEIIDEKPEELYKLLVSENKSMTFLSSEVRVVKADDESLDEHLELLNQNYSDLKIQTNYSEKELQNRLLSTYLTARTFIEERGVNTLFLALGMLNWKEADSSDKIVKAPLILVPVELTRSNARERFVLSYASEDIQTNVSLAAKLAAEFSIKINIDKEELDVVEYFDEIEQAIVSQKTWSVDKSSIVLGFFSFGKYLMYIDLDADKWPENSNFFNHPILNALLGDGFREPKSNYQEDEQIDKYINPSEVYHIVEADSSQILAILDVNSGRNMVIQGPPGTGKSQTITNIIADSVGRGKKVLFVSEKMAALEVVKRRLDNVCLGDACLELHSHKANKKVLLKELESTLELGAPKCKDNDDLFIAFSKVRNELNEYCDAVNKPVGNSKTTPYRAYGETIRIKKIFSKLEQKVPYIDLPGIDVWSDEDFSNRLLSVNNFKNHLNQMGIPSNNPFWGSKINSYLPSDKDKFEQLFEEFKSCLEKISELFSEICDFLKHRYLSDYNQFDKMNVTLKRYISSPDLSEVKIDNKKWYNETTSIRNFINSGIKINEIYRKYQPLLLDQVWDYDVFGIRQILAPFKGKWWRILSSAYRNANTQFKGLLRQPIKICLDERITVLDNILEYRSLIKAYNENKSNANDLFKITFSEPLSLPWDKLKATAEWMFGLYIDIHNGVVLGDIIRWFSINIDKVSSENYSKKINEDLSSFNDLVKRVVDALKLDTEKRFQDSKWHQSMNFDEIDEIVKTWQKRISELQYISIYNRFADELNTLGLNTLVEFAAIWEYAGQHLDKVFLYERYNSLLRKAFSEREVLARFDGYLHEQKILQYCKLDENLMNINRTRLLYEHWKRLPKNSSEEGQLGVLLWEFQKKSKHLPIRKLISKAGNVIQTIKPVMMMSPLSIANFIEPGCLSFDVVIFDEASQVRPVEAFGALMRAGQAVVVGDSCQMPPTSFFDNALDFSEDDEEYYVGDMESILGLFTAQNAPQRMLKWHYRSKHESLITVSNHEFYKNKLVVFPSADFEKGKVGLVYRYIPDSAYDRGKTRSNPIEAKQVALSVMKHAKETPELTLGVAAFSMAQMQAIIDQLEILRRQDASVEDFFQSHKEEPFFVKNLENVQGDERDVIFISIGYGKTSEGYISMEFGPLNREGGERRLNVLITRARLRCEIFTNLTADDIDLGRTNSRGVKSLKTFLSFAKDGRLDIPLETGKEEDSEFEQEVYEYLVDKGYTVKKQVGCAGFYIDLAVVNPEKPGCYLLGIECDGAAYHSARSARDRDRLRQAVLENKGWVIHRVWSTDWFRNPQKEMEKLEAAIKNAYEKRKCGIKAESVINKTATPIIERHSVPTTYNNNSAIHQYITAVNMYCDEYILYNPLELSKVVKNIVNVESPVHIDEVLKRVTNTAGVKRAGSRIQTSFYQALEYALRNGDIKKKEKFLWSRNMTAPILRTRENVPAINKKLEYVAPEEICLAIKVVVKDNFGMLQNDIPNSACRLLGFSRTTDDMNSIINALSERLLKSGELLKQGKSLIINVKK